MVISTAWLVLNLSKLKANDKQLVIKLSAVAYMGAKILATN